MSYLNDTMTWLGMSSPDALAEVVLNLASVTSRQLRRQKTSVVVDLVASLYIHSNSTVSPSHLINALQTTPEQFNDLVYFFGGADYLEKSVLWAKNIALPTAIHYKVRTELLALITVFIFWTCLTSVLRIYARHKLAAGISICDYILIIGTVFAVGTSFLFAAGRFKYSSWFQFANVLQTWLI